MISFIKNKQKKRQQQRQKHYPHTFLLTGFTPTWICILGNKLGLGCGKAPYLNDGLQAKGSKVSQYCKTEPRFSSWELVHPWVKKGRLGKERDARLLSKHQ